MTQQSLGLLEFCQHILRLEAMRWICQPYCRILLNSPVFRHATSDVKAMREAQAGTRHVPWHPSKERDAADPELAAVLSKVSLMALF